jgi:hypothetical protein
MIISIILTKTAQDKTKKTTTTQRQDKAEDKANLVDGSAGVGAGAAVSETLVMRVDKTRQY